MSKEIREMTKTMKKNVKMGQAKSRARKTSMAILKCPQFGLWLMNQCYDPPFKRKTKNKNKGEA